MNLNLKDTNNCPLDNDIYKDIKIYLEQNQNNILNRFESWNLSKLTGMDQSTLKRETARNDPGRLGLLITQCSGSGKLNYTSTEIENIAKSLKVRKIYTQNQKGDTQGNKGNKGNQGSRGRNYNNSRGDGRGDGSGDGRGDGSGNGNGNGSGRGS